MKKVALVLLTVGLIAFVISSLAKWQAAEKAERSAAADYTNYPAEPRAAEVPRLSRGLCSPTRPPSCPS